MIGTGFRLVNCTIIAALLTQQKLNVLVDGQILAVFRPVAFEVSAQRSPYQFTGAGGERLGNRSGQSVGKRV